MDLMKGKKGVIFGVSNTHGIAYAIAKQLYEAGAKIGEEPDMILLRRQARTVVNV